MAATPRLSTRMKSHDIMELEVSLGHRFQRPELL